MNFKLVVAALEFAYENRKEVASAAREAIHVFRRIELMCGKHNVNVDKALVEADKALSKISNKKNNNDESSR